MFSGDVAIIIYTVVYNRDVEEKLQIYVQFVEKKRLSMTSDILENGHARRRDRIKQSLLTAATDLFARHGVEDVSVEGILEAANVSRGTFYKIFASKEELLVAIVEPVFQFAHQELLNITSDNPEIIIEQIGEVYFQIWTVHASPLIIALNIGQKYFPLVQNAHDLYVMQLNTLVGKLQRKSALRIKEKMIVTRLIALSILPLLKALQGSDNFHDYFIDGMKGLLLKPGV
jgi:AcrR family transcriptional regulator